jgi:hypothetical protein
MGLTGTGNGVGADHDRGMSEDIGNILLGHPEQDHQRFGLHFQKDIKERFRWVRFLGIGYLLQSLSLQVPISLAG